VPLTYCGRYFIFSEINIIISVISICAEIKKTPAPEFPVQGDCVIISSGSRLRAAAFFFYNVLLLLRTDASLSISPCLISRSSAEMIFSLRNKAAKLSGAF
jgi:hypothetical protein